MLDESTNATNWSKKYVAIDRVYRGTDNRNRLVYSDWRLSWAVSNISYCCLNSNRWHIFGEGQGLSVLSQLQSRFREMNDPIRTTGARGHDFVFRCAASDPWVFYRFYWVFIADPKCPHHCFSKDERTYKYSESRF